MPITIDLQGAHVDTPGEAQAALERLRANPPGYLRELDDVDVVEQVIELGERLRDRSQVIVLGIGGSSLGARTVRDALAPEAQHLVFFDNIDPHTIEHLSVADDCVVLVISKSGSTAETLAQFLYLRSKFVERGQRWQDHVVIITDPEKGPLRELAEREGLPSLPVPASVGGRFSVLTPVGLLPAALVGVDIRGLLVGARRFRDHLYKTSAASSALCQLVDTHMAGLRGHDRKIQVLLSYSDRLATFGDWFAQLWAESLGKRLSTSGEEVWVGSTPVGAVGATDQHSLVQLFREGPDDKQYIVVGVGHHETEGALGLDAGQVHESFEYLSGRSLRELFEAERAGTVRALLAAGRPVTELELARVDAPHLGALFVLFEVLTALCGDLYDINPYDQPGVEAGKIAAFALMGREGYAERAEELFGGPAPDRGGPDGGDWCYRITVE